MTLTFDLVLNLLQSTASRHSVSVPWWFRKNMSIRPSIKLVAVDDTTSSLELLSEALQQDGLIIFTSTDPEKGLDLVYHEHPQIVLLDLVMPKMTGLEMLSESSNSILRLMSS